MADPERTRVIIPSTDQARAASGQFERAQQVAASGNFDYAIRLLRTCCQLDPSNLTFRQALRRTVRAKYRNNERGAWLAWVWNIFARMQLKRCLRRGDFLAALDAAEQVLVRNPWDAGAQIDLGIAAEALGLLEMATWSLEQARSRQQQDIKLIQQLALLYEKQKNYPQAAALWQLIRKLSPNHPDVVSKLHHLAAEETIERGQYQVAVDSGGGLRDRAERGDESTTDTTPETESVRSREAALLRKKIAKEPQRREHYLALAALYRAAGDLASARKVLERGLEPTSEASELRAELLDLEIEPLRRELSGIEEQLADADEADLIAEQVRIEGEINVAELEMYKQRIRWTPNDVRCRYEFGVRLFAANRTEEAIRELQQTREDAKFQWQSLLLLGRCFHARKNARLAIRNLQSALEKMPATEVSGRKEALYLLASLHADLSDLKAAVEYGSELADIDYTFRDIGQLLDTWQTTRPA